MTIEEMEKEVERLKSEIKKQKSKANIPDDIIKTPEYGWVKLLPCGIGENIYVYEFEFTSPFNRKSVEKLYRVNSINIIQYKHRVNEAISKIKWKIKTVPMKVTYYPCIGRSAFLTKEEAETKILEFVINELSYTEKGFKSCFIQEDGDNK